MRHRRERARGSDRPLQTYTLRDIESMLGLSRPVVAGLIDAGFVHPARGARNEYRFTFQDVVLLRTARSLQQASIPPRKILRSLRRLKATLPGELPLAGLRIAAVGNDVAVCEGRTQWQAESGQLLFDFEVQPTAGGNVRLLSRSARRDEEPATTDWFERGAALEASDMGGAEAAYRRALDEAPEHVDAALNLGVMLCDSNRCAEAVCVYERALQERPDEPLLYYNLGVALEDQGRNADAIAAYDACLALSPKFADAHFNAARLHELLGEQRQAIRHYSEYRRLQR